MRHSAKILGVGVVLAAAVGASAQTTIGTFTGGDPGEGLDFEGNFPAGLSVFAQRSGDTSTFTIGDATFTNVRAAGGTEIMAPNETDFGNTDFGPSANDDALQGITDFVIFGAGTGSAVEVDVPVTAGQQFKLQLLFNEACCDRGFDVIVEGVTIAPGFNPGTTQGDMDGGTPPGAVITTFVTAADGNIDISLLGTSAFSDNNAIFDAISVELVPEPGSLAVLGLSGLGLLMRRRRAA